MRTTYALAYSRSDIAPVLSFAHDESVKLLNLARFVRRDLSASLPKFAGRLRFIDDFEEADYSPSFVPLNDCIRRELMTGDAIQLREYDIIRYLCQKFVRHIAGAPRSKKAFPPSARSLTEWAPRLYARYGKNELRVLEKALRAPEELAKAAALIRTRISDPRFMGEKGEGDDSPSGEDAISDLRRLMIDSGFYMKDGRGSDASLELWLDEYLGALASAHFLFPAPNAVLQSFVVQDFLRPKSGELTPFKLFPPPRDFYRHLSGHSVAFVTPFHGEIASLFTGRKLFDLYTDIQIPEFDLLTIPAYVSTYPKRPHGSWAETFDALRDVVARVLDQKRVTLFFASCGCYSLPICRFVFERYSIPAAYFGSYLNTLFGVDQKSAPDFLPGRRKLENWARASVGMH